jgi:hypothetical protein
MYVGKTPECSQGHLPILERLGPGVLDMHRNKCAFKVIYGEASCSSKAIHQHLEPSHRSCVSPSDDRRVAVRVLKDGTRMVWRQRVAQEVVIHKNLLKNICHKNE